MQYQLHVFVEIYRRSQWRYQPEIKLFKTQPYLFSAFFCNVRNYNGIPFISEPRGWAKDMSREVGREIGKLTCPHDFSWLDETDLRNFNYDLVILHADKVRLRNLLTPYYFKDLNTLLDLNEKFRIITAIEG